MKYQILLEDRRNGRTALIECPASMVLEELSVKIKLELRLPLCDRGWHRFLLQGRTYVPWDHILAEPEIIWECTERYPTGYRSSEKIRLKQAFTVLGSAITYFQDEHWSNAYKVRCTLVERV